MFDRVPGVAVDPHTQYDMPRISNVLHVKGRLHNNTLPDGDYGCALFLRPRRADLISCALAHRRAWQAVLRSPYEWHMVLEDDAVLASSADVTVFPPVPDRCDLVLLQPNTAFLHHPVCRCAACMDPACRLVVVHSHPSARQVQRGAMGRVRMGAQGIPAVAARCRSPARPHPGWTAVSCRSRHLVPRHRRMHHPRHGQHGNGGG